MEFTKKIIKTGNSLSILLPREAKEMGFEENKKVSLIFEDNKIIITLQNSTEYKSKI